MSLLLLGFGCGGGSVGEAPGPTCEAGTPGRGVGNLALDVPLGDCAGEARSLGDLCGRPVLLVSWYGWCASCEGNAQAARALASRFADLAAVTALVEDPLSDTVTAAYCAAYEGEHPSLASVWMDETGELATYGETDLVLVLDRDGVIRFLDQTSAQNQIVAAVEDVIAE